MAGKGQLEALGAALLFSTGGAAIKVAAFSGMQVSCLRAGVATITLLLWWRHKLVWSWRAASIGVAYAATLTLFGAVTFFFASAGASAAYLTASEVFPMETRALCIAFFYAIGTAVGGITGPLLFGKLIDAADAITDIAPGYYLGAALMVAGGIVEIFLGVKAEGQSLEDIAQPLTAEDQPAGGEQRERSHA